MQHPSYTGRTLTVVGNFMLLYRVDAALGCWLPSWLVDVKWVWRVLALLAANRVRRAGKMRVTEEEEMLRNTFGNEWEEYHAKTKRFIPYLF